MKKLKIGAELQTREDVNNLILHLIKGAEKEFSASLIKNLTRNYTMGSPLRLTDDRIDQMVDNILSDLMLKNKLVCDYGMFVIVKNLNNHSSFFKHFF